MSQSGLALGPVGPKRALLSSLLPQDLPFVAPRGSVLRDWHQLCDFCVDLLSSSLALAPCRAWDVRVCLCSCTAARVC